MFWLLALCLSAPSAGSLRDRVNRLEQRDAASSERDRAILMQLEEMNSKLDEIGNVKHLHEKIASLASRIQQLQDWRYELAGGLAVFVFLMSWIFNRSVLLRGSTPRNAGETEATDSSATGG